MSQSEVEAMLNRIDELKRERDRYQSDAEEAQMAMSEALMKLRNGREQEAQRMLVLFS